MKIYCVLLINEVTGHAEHCATRAGENITQEELLEMDNLVGVDQAGVTYRIEKYEFENKAGNDIDRNFIRSDEVLRNVERVAGDNASRANPATPTTLKFGANASRFFGFQKVDDFTLPTLPVE